MGFFFEYIVYFYSKLFKVEGSISNEVQVTITQLNVIAINNISNVGAKLQTSTWNHVYLRVCTCNQHKFYSFYNILKKEAYCFAVVGWKVVCIDQSTDYHILRLSDLKNKPLITPIDFEIKAEGSNCSRHWLVDFMMSNQYLFSEGEYDRLLLNVGS